MRDVVAVRDATTDRDGSRPLPADGAEYGRGERAARAARVGRGRADRPGPKRRASTSAIGMLGASRVRLGVVHRHRVRCLVLARVRSTLRRWQQIVPSWWVFRSTPSASSGGTEFAPAPLREHGLVARLAPRPRQSRRPDPRRRAGPGERDRATRRSSRPVRSATGRAVVGGGAFSWCSAAAARWCPASRLRSEVGRRERARVHGRTPRHLRPGHPRRRRARRRQPVATVTGHGDPALVGPVRTEAPLDRARGRWRC